MNLEQWPLNSVFQLNRKIRLLYGKLSSGTSLTEVNKLLTILFLNANRKT